MNSSSGVPSLTGVVKYLIMINAIMFVGTYLLGPVPMSNMLGIHFVKSELFRPHQIVTHMFMHDGLAHLAINMFVLWMFGSTLEMVWGAKRFLIFYLSTGLGAVLLHQLVNAIEISSMLNEYSVQVIEEVYRNGADLIRDGQNWVDPELGGLNTALNGIALGASGAIFGVMVAFAVLFPNRELFLLLLPVPVKAKYYIPVLMIAELYLGVRNFELDNVAHFAHLGGAVFGYILLKIWQKDRSHFY